MSDSQVYATLVAMALCYLLLLALCCWWLTHTNKRSSIDE